MKIINKNNSIFQFKVGDVVRYIGDHNGDIWKKEKYKIIELNFKEVILHKSQKYGWSITINLEEEPEYMFDWVLNTKFVYSNYEKGITYSLTRNKWDMLPE